MTAKKDPKDLLKRGAPTKYKPKYCEMIIAHLESGLTFESFAGVIGVDRETLYEWAKRHPQFSNAKKTGYEKGYLFWDKINRTLCTGAKNMKVNGEVISSKNIPVAIFIFNMKNRFKWRDNHEVSLSADKSITLKYALPKKEKDEEE